MEFDQSRPIWVQVSEELTVRIVSGLWGPGVKIPSVRELAAQMLVNPNTVQKAFAQLERDGLVVTERASGRFVTEDDLTIRQCRQRMALVATEEYLTTMRRLGVDLPQIRELIELDASISVE